MRAITVLMLLAMGWPPWGGGGSGGTICGDSKVVSPEQCDDGNTTSGDGCSSTCTVEAGFYCRLPAPTFCYPSGALFFFDGDDLNGAFADAAPVTQWDAGGARMVPTTVDAAHEPLVEKAALNGHTAVLFDGTANAMKIEKSTTSGAVIPDSTAFDIFAVARWDSNGDGSGDSRYWLSDTQAATTRGLSLLIKSTRGTSGFVAKGDGTYHVNTIAAPTTATASAAKWHLIEVHGDAVNWRTSIDGGADETTAFANALTTGELGGDLVLGANSPTMTQFYDMSIALLVAYPRNLTSGERTVVRNAVTAKYGTLPASPTKRVAIPGDSIVLGAATNTPWPAKIESDLNAASHGAIATANAGVGGNTTTQILSRWTNNIRSQGYTHLVLEGCVNDLAGAADTAPAQTTAEALCETNWNTIITQATGDGLKVVLLTMTPWASYTGSSTNRQNATATFNAFIAGKASAGSIVVYDANADTNLGTGSPSSFKPANDSGDGLHPNQAGANIIAAAVETDLGLL